MINDLEHRLQKACVTWFRLQYPDKILFAVPNGGQRNQIVAKKLKDEGVLPGVSDLVILEKRCTFGAMFIEMKTEKGKQSFNQKVFENKVTDAGYKYVICRSLDEFRKEVNNYLNYY